MITGLKLTHFTAFESESFDFSPGINVLMGQNGTGKTHVLKIIYTALAAQREKKRVSDKIVRVFLPKEMRIGRLVRRARTSTNCTIEIRRDGKLMRLTFSNHTKGTLKWRNQWKGTIKPSVYIPVKEMLANAPGFRSLYASREIHFEEVYADLIDRAFLPVLKGPKPKMRQSLLEKIQKVMAGKVVEKNETFYLKNREGELEFTLLAEGLRKFALLWILIQNGTFLRGSTLLWDEPEANISPSMISVLADLLLHLQVTGVQIFIATHSYVLIREIELQRSKKNNVKLFHLVKGAAGRGVTAVSADSYDGLLPNNVSEAYDDIFQRELKNELGF